MQKTFRKKQVDIRVGGNQNRPRKLWSFGFSTVLFLAFLLGPLFALGQTAPMPASAQNGGDIYFMPFVVQDQPPVLANPLIHVPYFNSASVTTDHYEEMALFWFGRLSLVDNYTHVRTAYNAQQLSIELNIADAQLWYDAASPSAGEVNKNDAASIYLIVPTAGSGSHLLRFDAQLSHPSDNRQAYQAAFENTGSSWERKSIAFTTQVIYQGEGMNSNAGDKGWILNFEIPFASLGLAGRPANQSQWKMGIQVYDLDTPPGGTLRTQVWPTGFRETSSATFGSIAFGVHPETAPALAAAGSATIRQNATVNVPDGSVGGYSNCGGSLDYWSEWPNQVYNSADTRETIVIQNQREVAELPCFSRYYVTFPLSKVPRDRDVVSARLTLHHFGNSYPEEALPSYIQVFRVKEDWVASSLSWNNSPQVLENYPGTWVQPLASYPGVPGVAYDWDVTEAVRSSIAEGSAVVRLAMQSGDWARHSGKYFWASETGSWSSVTPPTLVVQWASQ